MTLPVLDVPNDAADDALPLPPGTGIRALRRRRRAQVRRQRILVAVALVAAVGATVFAIALPGDDNGPRVAAPTIRTAAAVKAPRLVLAHRGPDGKAISVTVLAPSQRGGSGTVLLIAPGTMTEVASLGLEPVADSLDLGGPARLQTTVENLLGVDLHDIVVLDDAQMVQLLEPYGSLPVRVPTRVEQVDASGAVEVLYEPGLIDLRPSELPQLLTVRGRDTALTLLARHQAFWQAYLERVEEIGADKVAVSSTLRKSLTGLVSGGPRVRVLPVEAVGRGENNDDTEGRELYQVRAKELSTFLTAAFPDDRSWVTSRPRIQVLNGTGAVEVAPRVSEVLVPAGMQVTLTGNAPRFTYDKTEIVFYDRSKQAVAERVRKALGTGKLILSRRPLGVVDVTVIVGKDFSPE